MIEEVPLDYRYTRGYESAETPAGIAHSCGCVVVAMLLLLGFFFLAESCHSHDGERAKTPPSFAQHVTVG